MKTGSVKRNALAGTLVASMPWCATAAPADEVMNVITRTPSEHRAVGTAPSATPDHVTKSQGDRDLRDGWPVYLGTPSAGFPYTPTLYDADGDGADEIFVTGGHTFVLRGDGTFMPGWPTTEMTNMGYGTNGNKPGAAVADLEGDGDVEVLWSLRDWWAGGTYMWCFNGKDLDATDLPGMPQQAIDQPSNALDVPFVLGDANGDGNLEAWGPHTLGNTFVHYRLSAFDHLGNRLFTTDLNPTENILCLYFGDLEGDGAKEMFAVTWLDPIVKLHVFESDGEERTGYPVKLTSLYSAYLASTPAVPVDVDGDGDLEILFGYWGGGSASATCYHHNGALCAGFPFQIATDSQLFSVGLGDVTGDGEPELVALDNHLGGAYRAHVMDMAAGSPLTGWPFTVPNWPKGFPAIVDVDDDGVQDVCFVTDGGKLYALSNDGTQISGYPKSMISGSISGVAAGDIDADGLFELVAATWDGYVYAWDTPSHVKAGSADWPMRGVNAQYTGVLGDSPYSQSCDSDVTGDDIVDVLDLLAVLAAWGTSGSGGEDITGDGVVDVLDLLEVLSGWGPC